MALAPHDGEVALCAKGAFGDSQSTTLTGEVGTPTADAMQGNGEPMNGVSSGVLHVRAVTVRTLVKRYSVRDCSFMKIDVEGSEKTVIPALETFLRSHRPTLYVSLHWTRLSHHEIEEVFNLLSSIYDSIYDDSLRHRIDGQRLISERISSVVCTSDPLSSWKRFQATAMTAREKFQLLPGKLCHRLFQAGNKVHDVVDLADGQGGVGR